jgi:hypothetical protein
LRPSSAQHRWIDDSQPVVLVQKRLLLRDARFHVVNAFDAQNVPSHARIHQASILGDRLGIDGSKIRKGLSLRSSLSLAWSRARSSASSSTLFSTNWSLATATSSKSAPQNKKAPTKTPEPFSFLNYRF